MKRKYAKGDTVSEQIDRIDKTLQHMSRHLSRKVIGLIPAAPVFKFIFVPETDGTVLNVIFPADGRITKSCIYVASKSTKGPALFRLTLKRGNKSWVDEFEVKRTPLVFELDMPVVRGDLFSLVVEEPEAVKGIWVGFLYEVGIVGLGKKELVFDQLDQLVEEDNAVPREEKA